MRAGIVGAGGHGLDLAEIMRAAGWEFAGWWDDGENDHLPAVDAARAGVPVLVGVNDPLARAAIIQRLGPVITPMALVHPSAVVGGGSTVGAGSVLAANVVLTTCVIVGRHTHLNVGTTVSQSSELGDFCTVGPGARICGDVTIGDRVFIGAGAVILNLARVCDDAVVGAGAVVLPGQVVPAGETWVGVPARRRNRVAANLYPGTGAP